MRNPYHPHGAALLDCYRGKRDAVLTCHQDGERDDVPAAFWLRSEMHPFETLALKLCRGRVLDIGAGAGLHSLELQRRGFDVTAIDVAEQCVEIMRDRGVRNAVHADLFDFHGGPFDTILCLCNGLDKVGRLADMPGFLARMRLLLAPGGQVLADSFDIRVGADEARSAMLARKAAAERYFGEIDLRFEYEGVAGEPFTTLQVDFQTLACISIRAGWTSHRIAEHGGHYLARLAQPGTDGRPPCPGIPFTSRHRRTETMSNEHLYLILWAVLSFWVLGQVWFCQIVVYPLFARVGDGEYTGYHRAYGRRIPAVVIAPGFATFFMPGLLIWLIPSVPAWMHLANVTAGIIGLLLTACLLIPRHHRLEGYGKNDVTISELVRYNWPRTVSVTLQSAVTCGMLAHVMQAPS